MYTATSGLRFSNDTYNATVWETPADDAVEAALGSNPPTPMTGVILTPICVEYNGTAVTATDLRYSIVEGNTTLFTSLQ